VGTSVFVRDQASQIRAFSVTTGAPLWSGNASPVSDVHSALSSDGTRIYAIAQCELYAVNISDGSVAWHTPVVANSTSCSSGSYLPGPPIVLNGKVYATQPEGKMVANALTGAPEVRFAAWGFNGGTSVVVGGAWIFLNDNRLVAVDTTTGELIWLSEQPVPIGAKVSATGDLILVATDYDVKGVDRLTGATAWDGGAISGVSGSAVVGTRRILVPTQQGVRAYGPL
jgi:outer membrane protein assembly factor BamB